MKPEIKPIEEITQQQKDGVYAELQKGTILFASAALSAIQDEKLLNAYCPGAVEKLEAEERALEEKRVKLQAKREEQTQIARQWESLLSRRNQIRGEIDTLQRHKDDCQSAIEQRHHAITGLMVTGSEADFETACRTLEKADTLRSAVSFISALVPEKSAELDGVIAEIEAFSKKFSIVS